MIDSKLIVELKNKIIAIIALPHYPGENDFDSITDIDEDGIGVRTTTSYGCCGDDYSTEYFSWEELNEPLEHFEKKFLNLYNKREQAKLENKNREEEAKKKKEYEDYLALKKKFGN